MKKKIKLRTIFQIIFFILIGLISVNHVLVENGNGIPLISDASIHTLCPFGGVVSFYQYVTTGTLVKQVHFSAIVLMYIVFAIALIFGPMFCGWICPLGSFQEWIGKIGKKIFPKRYNKFIPSKVHSILKYFRFVMLALVIINTARAGILVFQNIDPYNALFKFWTGEVAITAIVVLIVIIIASLFVERPWCKYLCPYGALLGITNKFRIVKLRRNKSTCISCEKCDRSCPMNIEVSRQDVVKDFQCISCFQCTSEENCPIDDTVYMGIKEVK